MIDEFEKVKSKLEKDLSEARSYGLQINKEYVRVLSMYTAAFEAGQNAARRADGIIKKLDSMFQRSLTLNQKLVVLLPDEMQKKIEKEYSDVFSAMVIGDDGGVKQ